VRCWPLIQPSDVSVCTVGSFVEQGLVGGKGCLVPIADHELYLDIRPKGNPPFGLRASDALRRSITPNQPLVCRVLPLHPKDSGGTGAKEISHAWYLVGHHVGLSQWRL